MSWNDYYRRRDILDAVLEQVEGDPTGPLPYTEVPGATDEFAGEDELLLALHYRWNLKLTGRLGVALAAAKPGEDAVDVVGTAYRNTAEEFPALRSVLDTHEDSPALRPGLRHELRMLAHASGLASMDDTADEAAEVGGALLALVRSAPAPIERRRNRVERLLDRFVASA